MSSSWKKYIHKIRNEEIKIAFSNYSKNQFKCGLELGAGEGYQSAILVDYCEKLVCTELNEKRLKRLNIKGIEYKICDAEIIQSYFNNMKFDLVFSSNMFEHLPNPENALIGIKNILTKDGIVILIMPSPFWAICHIILYYPVFFINVLKRKFFLKQKNIKNNSVSNNKTNNLKIKRAKRFFLLNLIRWPYPHGVSKTHFKELMSFKKQAWVNMFLKNDFHIIDIKKGPITSGYGLNLNFLRCLCKHAGLTSEYIYFIKKNKNTV